MKTTLFFLAFVMTHALSYSQCKRQFSKITKVEQGYKKDPYGNVTDERFVKCTLPNGQIFSEYNAARYLTNSYQAEYGATNLLFTALNASKTVFFEIIRTENRIKIFTVNYYDYNPNKFTSGLVQWDPALNEQIGTSRLDVDGFDTKEGWAFSKLAGDILVMTKNGIEYKFTIAKTQESYCDMYFKLVQ